MRGNVAVTTSRSPLIASIATDAATDEGLPVFPRVFNAGNGYRAWMGSLEVRRPSDV